MSHGRRVVTSVGRILCRAGRIPIQSQVELSRGFPAVGKLTEREILADPVQGEDAVRRDAEADRIAGVMCGKQDGEAR